MADALAYRPKEDEAPRFDNDDGEDDELVDETGYKTVRDAVLFAIDVSKSMMKRPPITDDKKADDSSPLEAALSCAYQLMQQRIISAPKDLIGILLYGTKKQKFYEDRMSSRGGWAFPNCYLLTDLDIPEADDVRTLKALVNDEDNETTAAEIFDPSDVPVPMHTVLFCANQIFQQKASNFTSRRLFVVTDNDNPHANDKDLRSQATVRAKDLYDLGVTIELFPISSRQHTFDTALFWDDIVYKMNPDDPEAILYTPPTISDIDKSRLRVGSTDGINLLQSLLNSVASRATPKRALFSSAHLEIGDEFRIGIKGFLLYKHQLPERKTYVYLQGEKPLIAKGVTTKYADDDDGVARNIDKPEIRKAYDFGSEKIAFKPEELTKLRNFGTPVVRIIGFKPMDRLPDWANIKTSTFIYPFEEHFVGSVRVYSALYQKLVKCDLFALAWYIPRVNAAPVLAALIPTLTHKDTNGRADPAGASVTGAPQGLHLIPLPFADDLRQNPPARYEKPLRSPESLDRTMEDILSQLILPGKSYQPSRYPNPSLQWHYRVLQAMALEEDVPEVPEDKTRPKYRQIAKRVGDLAVLWGAELEKVYKAHLSSYPDAAVSGEKRPTARSATTDGVDEKRVKIKPEASEEVSEEIFRKLYHAGKLPTLKVTQLTAFATAKGLRMSSKKKADLIEQIEGWFEKK